MAQHAAKIVLLDHHKSAASQWIGVEPIPNVDLLFDMDRSGAQMAWDYFHPGSIQPPLIEHIGDRDLWRFGLADTKAFCAGLSLIPTSFESWQLAATHPADLIAKGLTVLEVLQRQIDSVLRKDLRPVTLCGYQGLSLRFPRIFTGPRRRVPLGLSVEVGRPMALGASTSEMAHREFAGRESA